MARFRVLTILVMLAVLGATPGVFAQVEDCHCDCYFSGDCESGNFCDWGPNLFDEDACWWRTPKPQSNVGAGCHSDYGSFGECDGKCIPLGGAAFGSESIAKLRLGVALWADALTDASLRGGGTPSRDAVAEIEAIGFQNPTMSYGLWRIVTEALMLARGGDYLVFPPMEGFTLWDVAVADLTDDPVGKANGDVVIGAILAEMVAAGNGRAILDNVVEAALDPVIYGRICGDEPTKPIDCLYTRVGDMATVLRGGAGANAGGANAPGANGGGANGGGATAGGAAAGDVQPSCPGCAGDIDPSDAVDFQDLLLLLSRWGDESFPLGDLNGDGVIGFDDLTRMLAEWGNCA